MSRVQANIAANFIGTGLTVALSLVFVPVYIRFLGIEAYGLVGILAVLQATFSILDLGLSSTLNREVARLAVLPGRSQEMRDLTRTLEVVYWALAVLITLLLVWSAPLIARYWIHPGRIGRENVLRALLAMALLIGIQWPGSLYAGGLMGLQRQVLLNQIRVAIAVARAGGTLLVLWLVAPTIEAFLVWQIAVGFAQTVLVRAAFWRILPAPDLPAHFRAERFRTIWKFAAGMSGIAVFSVLLMQMDKILLSRLLSLRLFGYYTLASVVAMSLYRLVAPIFAAVYPRLTEVVAAGDQHALALLYHRSCQLMSAVILPPAVLMIFFAQSILLVWTQNAEMAHRTYVLVMLLTAGTALNGLMNVPYALQLAHGWTGLTLAMNAVSLIVLGPLIYWATLRYGMIGAASMWPILNAGYILVGIPVMHGRLLAGEQRRWYLEDVGRPLLAAFLVSGIGSVLFTRAHSSVLRWSLFSGTALTVVAVTVWSLPMGRAWLVQKWSQGWQQG